MQKLNLVTVVGHNTTMLPHMINHYWDLVDEIFVVVYRQHENDGILEEIENMNIIPFKVVTEPKFNWERVTELYNKVKRTEPDSWWIVSDDDEFHVYPNPIREIVAECEIEGYEFITGGFLDRIGENGSFPVVNDKSNIWELFPYAGFFRYPMSGAMPNKCCVMKGKVDVTNGQHFAVIGDTDTWRERGWFHPNRYPIEKGLVQVHHFKWDSTVMERLKEVSNTRKSYTYWKEYHKMYRNLYRNGHKVDISNPDFYIQKMNDNSYNDYKKWPEISRIILNA